jgi:hypothetical protein
MLLPLRVESREDLVVTQFETSGQT